MGSILYIFWTGFGSGGEVVVPIADIGLEWTAPRSLLNFEAFAMRLDYTAPKSRVDGEANEP